MAEQPLSAPADFVTPNTPSEPVWSLHPKEAREHEPVPSVPTREVPPAIVASSGNKEWNSPREEMPPAPREKAIAGTAREPSPESAALNEPSQPARKGWWQRPFKLRD
jgi:hypothetical protein